MGVNRSVTKDYEGRRWLALAVLCFAQFIVVLDGSIVNVALPSMGRDLGFAQEDLSWVLNAYVLTFGGLLLLGGRLADLLGRRRVFVAGLLLVGVASLVAGFAATGGQLIAARAVQGLGAAIISPSALSLITTTFREPAELNRAFGVWGGVAGSAGAAGVLLGGVLTEGLGWEWVLWVNVPIALIAAALVPHVIAESRAQSGSRRFDVLGAVTITAGMSILVYAIVDAADAGFGSAQTVVLLAAAALLIAAFVATELRSAAPLVPLAIFRVRTLTGANVVGLMIGASLISMFFFITLYLQQVLGYSAIEAGLAYLPLALTIVLASAVASRLVTRLGVKPVLSLGMAAIAVALLWFSRISVDGGFAVDVLGPSILAGAGLGLAMVPDTVAAMTGIRPQETGLAGGLINTSQQIGGALGLAVLAAIATARTGSTGDASALNGGFQSAFLGGVVIAGLGLALTLVLMTRRQR